MFGLCLDIVAVGHGCTVRDILMHLVIVFVSCRYFEGSECGMWVLFLFVCERARVSVVWSPLGWGVVSSATAPVSWYFSAAQENENCQPLVPAGFVG